MINNDCEFERNNWKNFSIVINKCANKISVEAFEYADTKTCYDIASDIKESVNIIIKSIAKQSNQTNEKCVKINKKYKIKHDEENRKFKSIIQELKVKNFSEIHDVMRKLEQAKINLEERSQLRKLLRNCKVVKSNCFSSRPKTNKFHDAMANSTLTDMCLVSSKFLSIIESTTNSFGANKIVLNYKFKANCSEKLSMYNKVFNELPKKYNKFLLNNKKLMEDCKLKAQKKLNDSKTSHERLIEFFKQLQTTNVSHVNGSLYNIHQDVQHLYDNYRDFKIKLNIRKFDNLVSIVRCGDLGRINYLSEVFDGDFPLREFIEKISKDFRETFFFMTNIFRRNFVKAFEIIFNAAEKTGFSNDLETFWLDRNAINFQQQNKTSQKANSIIDEMATRILDNDEKISRFVDENFNLLETSFETLIIATYNKNRNDVESLTNFIKKLESVTGKSLAYKILLKIMNSATSMNSTQLPIIAFDIMKSFKKLENSQGNLEETKCAKIRDQVKENLKIARKLLPKTIQLVIWPNHGLSIESLMYKNYTLYASSFGNIYAYPNDNYDGGRNQKWKVLSFNEGKYFSFQCIENNKVLAVNHDGVLVGGDMSMSGTKWKIIPLGIDGNNFYLENKDTSKVMKVGKSQHCLSSRLWNCMQATLSETFDNYLDDVWKLIE